MTTSFKSFLFAIFLTSFQVAYSAPASQNLINKLDTKITYQSEGENIGKQLKKFADMVDVYFDIDSNAQENLKTKTIKFTYSQIRAKYIMYRLLKEAGLKYKFDGESIDIYKD
jgi:hypothetical protein